jgi:RNA polymerase sigma-70 factor, ECF subfamily
MRHVDMSLGTDHISPDPTRDVAVSMTSMTPQVLIAVAVRGLALPVIQKGSRRSHPTKIVWHVAQRSEPSGHITSVTREARFDALFEEHYRAVARFVRTRGHGPGDADDLIAGTFEVAWRQMDKVPEGREALPWLLGIARNLSRNARRKSRREASFVNELSTVTVTVPWAEMPIEDRAASAEVMDALARLKPADRDLILLVAWDELSPSEAGQVLGLRPVTARSRLHRARQRLSALLTESTASASGTPPASSPTSEPNQEENRER